MSTESRSRSHAGDRTVDVDPDGAVGPGTFRLLALCCVMVLTASYVSVLREVTRVVGGTETLLALVGIMLVAATVLAWAIRPLTATVGAIGGGVVGFAYYFEHSGFGVRTALAGIDILLSDALALVTGLPLLRMVEADVWTLAFVPAPVFLSWYLAMRGRYALGVVPGGAALIFLVLTGNAGTTITLLGTMAAVGAVGFGELERRGGSIAQADLLAVLFALIVVLSLSVTLVPQGTDRAGFAGVDEGTLEGTIDHASQRSTIGGSVELSPEVRFTVESDRASYWRTGVYDRFTGDEWVRTGGREAYDGPIATPPGESERVRQVITAETALGVMPAAPQPLTVEGDLTRHTEVSAHGQIHPTDALLEGDTYVVESAIIDPDADELRTAGTDYPDAVTDRYLQTPEGTSSEFAARTAEITAGAETPYGKAAAIESYLRTAKEYSLEVDRPSGNVAEAFLLEMEQGYCVYFATTMTQMLREEGIPARYVTGYTSGQQVGDDEYVVRGTDAHAWVEVYFPDYGWVAFDPTPPDTRNEVHRREVQQARESGNENVDTASSDDVPISPEEDERNSDESDGSSELVGGNRSDDWNASDPATGPGYGPDDGNDSRRNDSNQSRSEPPDRNGANESIPESERSGEEGWLSRLVDLVSVSRETVAVVFVVLTGLLAGVHRTDGLARLRRTLGLYWQRSTDDPDRDAERAYRRLERLLASEYRPREPAESARSYLEALADESARSRSEPTVVSGAGPKSESESEPERANDPRLETVLERYERAVYGGGVDREAADEAMAIVDDLARERLPIVGRNGN